MAGNGKQAQAAGEGRDAVMRTFVRGRLGRAPEFARTVGEEQTAICRMLVLGRAAGPASSPPKVSLYLKGAEAKRCALGLRAGDLIEAVGNIGPERAQAHHQEVLVDKQVKLLARAGGSACAR